MKPISPSVHIRSESLKGFIRGATVALSVVGMLALGAFLLPGVLEIISLFAFQHALLVAAGAVKAAVIGAGASIGSLANAGMILGGITLGGGALGAAKGATQGAYHNHRISTCNPNSPLCGSSPPERHKAEDRDNSPPIETLGMQPDDVARIRKVRQAQPVLRTPAPQQPIQRTQGQPQEQIPLDALKMPPDEVAKRYEVRRARPATAEEMKRVKDKIKPVGTFTANVMEERNQAPSLQRG